MPTAIIADDERLMRDQLRSRLAQVWPELEIVGEAKNGEEAIQLVDSHHPDLAFLDIRMPAKTGLEAAKEIGTKAHIVFITAYDQYAVEAFDQGAVDYVLKPADIERLSKTVERLKARLTTATEPNDMSNMLAQLAKQLGITPKANYLQWIQASIGQELRLIPVEDILFFQSDEKYTRVVMEDGEVLIRKPIKELIDELDPDKFWQIHRSTLVNTHQIAGVVRGLRDQADLKLKSRPEVLTVSRGYTHLFKQM